MNRDKYDYRVNNDGSVTVLSYRALEWERDKAIEQRDMWYQRWASVESDHTALTNAIIDILERPIHPYSETSGPVVPEWVFLADAYGPEIVEDFRVALEAYGAKS